MRDKLWAEEVQQMVVTPTERKGWSYSFATNDWECLTIATNRQHTITNVSFTRKYKGLGLSLKRARKKWFRVCRYLGLARWLSDEN